MTPRIPEERDLLALKSAFHELVRMVGGLDVAASYTRVSITTLATYYHPQHMERFAPLDVVAVLEAVAQDEPVTGELARLREKRLAAIDGCQPADLQALLAVAARESGEAISAQLSGAPQEVVQRESLEAAEAFENVAAALKRRRPKSSPAAPTVKGEGAPAVRRPAPGGGGGRQPRRQSTTTQGGRG